MTEQTPEEYYEPETELPAEAQVLPVSDDGEWADGTTPYDDPAETQDPEIGNENQPAQQIRTLIGPQVRYGEDAARWALDIYRWSPSGMCQQFTRSCFAVNSYYGSAIAAWNGADHKHRTSNPYDIPRGVPVFWSGGSRGYGHVSFSLGNGYIRSTDWPRAYAVGTARVTDIHNSWGHTLLGWTEDINNVRVWEKKPAVSYKAAREAMLKGEPIPNGRLLKRALAKEVGKGDMHLNTGILGAGAKKAYQEMQVKYLKGYGVEPTPRLADGIPGINSLTWLGRRHGFDVL